MDCGNNNYPGTWQNSDIDWIERSFLCVLYLIWSQCQMLISLSNLSNKSNTNTRIKNSLFSGLTTFLSCPYMRKALKFRRREREKKTKHRFYWPKCLFGKPTAMPSYQQFVSLVYLSTAMGKIKVLIATSWFGINHDANFLLSFVTQVEFQFSCRHIL